MGTWTFDIENYMNNFNYGRFLRHFGGYNYVKGNYETRDNTYCFSNISAFNPIC
jgi:hypothetical protein